MTPATPADVRDRITAAVAEAVERVFDTVAEVHAAAVASLRSGPDAGGERDRLDEQLQALLGTPGQLAVGLGLVVAPRPEGALPLRLQWWQQDRASGTPRALEPDLRPTSLGYYDYTATDWFDVPRRTGRRHVVGPYVDVHGTGQYLLTFTGPVVLDGEFVGVVGADVPVNRFETHLLATLGALRQSFVLVDGEDRVVLSTSPRALVGDLLRPGDSCTGRGAPVPGTPWRLRPTAA